MSRMTDRHTEANAIRLNVHLILETGYLFLGILGLCVTHLATLTLELGIARGFKLSTYPRVQASDWYNSRRSGEISYRRAHLGLHTGGLALEIVNWCFLKRSRQETSWGKGA